MSEHTQQPDIMRDRAIEDLAWDAERPRRNGGLKLAYADPPYLGCCGLYDHHHPSGNCWDDLETHAVLIDRLVVDYPDGWALSLSSVSLQAILSLCPADVRVMAWVKPFAAFKRNVRVAYAWEPVIVRVAERLDGATPTRDFVAEPITMRRGFTGAKPERFCFWLFDAMGLRPGDQLDDLFPGSGAVGRAWRAWQGRTPVDAGEQAAMAI